MWGDKGTHFKDRIFHRGTATHTNTGSLSPLHKTFANVHSLYFDLTPNKKKKSYAFAKQY